MKNGQNKNNVKFTNKKNKKTLVAENMDILMNSKNISIQNLSDSTGISRQQIYNILDGAIPRDSTLEIIADALGVTVDKLRYGERHFDSEYFRKKLSEKFPYHIDEEDFEDFIKGTNCEDIDSLDIESFLIDKFSLDPYDTFVKYILPAKEKQIEIASYFGYEVEDIFKPYGNFPINSSLQNIKHINVMSKEEFDTNKFNSLFERLNMQNKKLVLNLCLDLLQIQNN